MATVASMPTASDGLGAGLQDSFRPGQGTGEPEDCESRNMGSGDSRDRQL